MSRSARISGYLLRFYVWYATFFGILTFRFECKDFGWVATNRRIYKLFCLATRVLIIVLFVYAYIETWPSKSVDWLLKVFHGYRMIGCVFGTVFIILLQTFLNQELLDLCNLFLQLFGRLRNLLTTEHHIFGGCHELVLMSFKVLCLMYLFFAFQFPSWSMWTVVTVLSEVYTSIGLGMVTHICFLGYLSLGILYNKLNHFVDCQLRAQLSCLSDETMDENGQIFREAIANLDACLSLYDGFHQVAKRLQKLLNFPLFVTLTQTLFALSMVSYHAIMRHMYIVNLWGLVIKLLLDVLLLNLAVYRAVNASRLVRRLSLENYYISDKKTHHIKLELFLGRLNHQELCVRPLGLFEVSNELTLFFLSAMITYLTFLAQYTMQLQKN
ncbi:hypothetical protein KR018_008000 [Drosophila ironensis]|nr:hypothetical protein KR018_008000 [Drosophila ironensis]